MRGISADGGVITIQGNKIFENWFWGITLKTRTTGNVQNNEVFSNKCGGIRVGTNYSARILIDSNTIRDHPGPALHTEVLRPETKRLLKDMSIQSKIQEGMPQDKVTLYISPPMLTDRNIIRKNGVGKLLKTNPLEICANCHSKGDLLKCTKCRKTQYCGKACQKQHWNKHKRICKIISGESSVVIKMKETKTSAGLTDATSFCIRIFDPSLKGIGEGIPPDPDSTQKFVVKVQAGNEARLYDPEAMISLYDQTVQLDIWLVSPTLYHIVMECGTLGANQFTSKKVYFWANYEKKGEVLRIHIDDFPPTPTW
ncbi:unnamed protein product [Owenia fusiformis]|uniref:MYND-type domain-containing protein n=1 Tax=Owenia fusiformis TaxID=6347 RepID=A0A8S4PXB1_OWEFU|nr:unnamed protein product [Owenia fusiformis]